MAFFYSSCKGFLHFSKPFGNHAKSKQRIELLRNKFPGAPDHWLEKIGDCGELDWLRVDLKGSKPLQINVPLLSSKILPLNKETCNAKNDNTKGEINEGRSYHHAHMSNRIRHIPYKAQGDESKKETSLKSINVIKFLEVKSKTTVKNKTLDVVRESNAENRNVRVMQNSHQMREKSRHLRVAATNGEDAKQNRKEKQAEFSEPFKRINKIASDSNAEMEAREKMPRKSSEALDSIKKHFKLQTISQSPDCEVAQLSREFKWKKCEERFNDEKKRDDQNEYKRVAFREREQGFPNMLGQKVEGNSQKGNSQKGNSQISNSQKGNSQISLDRWPSLPETEDFLQDEDFDSIGYDVEETKWNV